ncbi:MAG: hypothetical protein H6718_17510 [Polyangiaceae bacterium]|nr:hypothetical protein [Polyangiaceae bacterium]MCB9609417.1 hypothetical protein [Polyangiaceae bacterium]
MTDQELSAEDALELEALELELQAGFPTLELESAIEARLVAFAGRIPEVIADELGEDDDELEQELGALFDDSAAQLSVATQRRFLDHAELAPEADLRDLFERTSAELSGPDLTRVAARSKDAPQRAAQEKRRGFLRLAPPLAAAAAAVLAIFVGFGGGASDTAEPQAGVKAPSTLVAEAKPIAKTAEPAPSASEPEFSSEDSSLMVATMVDNGDDDFGLALDALDTPEDDEDLDALLSALDDVANEGG